MVVKLVVQKFESNTSFQSLQVTIEEGGNNTSNVRYSEWMGGRVHKNKKDHKSRLVVKIVSDSTCNFNLDSCAKKLNQSEVFTDPIIQPDFDIVPNKSLYKPSSNNFTNYDSKCSSFTKIMSNPMALASYDKTVSPLEYSIEKVKENNARIMQNIHLLNRTLSYTKEKESCGNFCSAKGNFPCNTCSKCLAYRAGFKNQVSNKQIANESQPNWQVIWLCIECFQVWPEKILALEHSSLCSKKDSVDRIREIRATSLLQCEFCEKVFSSTAPLLSHSKSHTTSKNYVCNPCELSFSSYKSAEQHWFLCSFLKIYYTFPLPKMLICNACDAKFGCYEQLYYHRYKMAHFITKTHYNKGGIKALDLLVYQCELCVHWFHSTQLLQAHKHKNHMGHEYMTR